MRPGRAADHSFPSSAVVKAHPLGHIGPVTGSLYVLPLHAMVDMRVNFGLLCLKCQNSGTLAIVMLPLRELGVLAVPANVMKFMIIGNISEHCDPWRRTAELIRFYLLQYDINKFCVNYL